MQAFDTFRIGNDPELRYTPGNNSTAVINLSLACNYGRKDEATGKRPTQWVDATLWGRQAEALAPYLFKGSEVTVTLDDLHIEEFQRSGGAGVGFKLAGRISNLKLVGGVPQQQQAASPQSARQPAPRQQQGNQQQRPQSNQQQQPQPQEQFYDDDIPF